MSEEPSEPEKPKFGRVRVSLKDSTFSARCDVLVTNHTSERSSLMAVSCFGAQTTIKSIRAALQGSRSVPVEVEDCPGVTRHSPKTFVSDNEWGYECRVSKLGFDTWQLVAVSKSPMFLPVYSRRSVLDRLKSPIFTTPLLDGWIDWIVKDLKAKNLLRECPSFGCRSAYLILSDEMLDKIVAKGLSEGHLSISKEFATC